MTRSRPGAPVAFALLAIATLAVVPPALHGQPHRAPLRVGLFHSAADGNWERGALSEGIAFGLEEMSHTAELLGRSIDVVALGRPSDPSRLRDAARAGRIAVMIGGQDPEDCRMLADLSATTGVVWMNAACALAPPAACAPTIFHVGASDAMKADARRLAGAGGDAAVLMWHDSLERYGAAQLSERFRRRFGRPMSDAAWAGWTAVKAAWEASARARDSTPAALAAALSAPTFAIDAHKGRPLGFRTRDQHLRQPLYVRAGAELVEVPLLARGASARAALDSLGANGPACDGGTR